MIAPRFLTIPGYVLLLLLAAAWPATGLAQDQAPVVQAPATATFCSGFANALVVTASDPDGDPIQSLTAAPLPAGAVFTSSADNTSGTFQWSPTAQDPPVSVVFTASNALTGSATTTILPTICDTRPSVTAPATVSGKEGVPIHFVVSAATADGEPIEALVASGAPPGASFTTNAAFTSGSFDWTPALDQAGLYTVTFLAATPSGATGSASTSIQVSESDLPPVVTAPSFVRWGCGDPPILFSVTASDPEGDPITSLTASPLPSGATFTANASNTSGTFEWLPNQIFQIGSYSITFTAANTLSGSATTSILVTCVDRAPVVTAPTSATVAEGANLTFTVTAVDPDGDAIVTLQALTLPTGASFTSNAAHTSGTFSWTPDFTQGGFYSVTFYASNALSGSATTEITVTSEDCQVQLTAPSAVTGFPGTPLTFTVSANTFCGEPIASLTATPIPAGAFFTTNATQTSGTFAWTPAASQTGIYLITFTASVAGEPSVSRVTQITIDLQDPPVADAGGPYSGVVGAPISFDGTGSFDPDGDPLSYAWDFGDGTTAFGPLPGHTYVAVGVYVATLTVTAGGLSDSDEAEVTVSGALTADILTKNRHRRIRLGGNSFARSWCARLEPVGGSWSLSNIDPTSVRLLYGGGGIAPAEVKTSEVSDSDGDGILELEVCFLIAELSTMGFPQGTSLAEITIRGSLFTGGSFSGTTSIEVVNGSGNQTARVTPNPLNPDAVLSFEIVHPGAVTVQLFDLAGRLVRTLREASHAEAGRHEIRIDGRAGDGTRLASGVYFYRILSADGVREGRFTILK